MEAQTITKGFTSREMVNASLIFYGENEPYNALVERLLRPEEIQALLKRVTAKDLRDFGADIYEGAYGVCQTGDLENFCKLLNDWASTLEEMASRPRMKRLKSFRLSTRNPQ